MLAYVCVACVHACERGCLCVFVCAGMGVRVQAGVYVCMNGCGSAGSATSPVGRLGVRVCASAGVWKCLLQVATMHGTQT